MSKKTERKNKINLNVNWPKTPYFTIEDIFALNKDGKEITLRVRLSKQIEQGKAVEIGCLTGEQGRPRKVFVFTPLTQAVLDLARANHISLVDQSKLKSFLALPVPVNPFASKPLPVAA